jgi:iron-sulfur cluster repair protein YtfE (RIC family)
MSHPTLPLHEEHQTLLPEVEKLRQVADSIGELSDEALRGEFSTIYAFLTGALLPHASAEDQVLYPVVEEVMGAGGATATMSRDHVEVGRLISEFGLLRAKLTTRKLDAAEEKELRRILYGLYAVLKLHFAKEEEIYLPLLDEALAPERARAMFEQMEESAEAARSRPLAS